MSTPKPTPKLKLSLNLPEDMVKRVKVEAVDRGKGVTEATIVQEALELHWAYADSKNLIQRLKKQHQANVPLHEIDFGMKLSMAEKLFLLDQAVREQR